MLTAAAAVYLMINLISLVNGQNNLTLVAEAQLDTTTSFIKLSAKMIKLSSGNYRLCVGGVAASGAVGKFVTRDIFSAGSIPVSTSESEPKLPSTYTQLSDVSVMDSANDKCYYSVIHDDGDGTSSFAIVQADIGPPTPIQIPFHTDILTVNVSSTSYTYLINSNTQSFSTAFNAVTLPSSVSMCGSPLSDSSVLYAVARKSNSVLIGFTGNTPSLDTSYSGSQVACDAWNSSQWLVCWDTQTIGSTVTCRNSLGTTAQMLQDVPSIELDRPSVAYLNSNAAAVVMHTNISKFEVVVIDATSEELLRFQSESMPYGQLIADAMNDVLTIVWNNATGLYVRTYLFTLGSTVPTSGPSSSPVAAPSVGVPATTPVATPENAPVASGPLAPVTSTPRDNNTPSAAIGNTPEDPKAVGADVLGPAIAIPIAAVAVGVFLLIFFLKKKKANQKKANDGDDNMTIINPANDSGRYSAIVSATKDDGINPTAIQPSEIDKRMHIPYSSLLFTKEIGAGSYGKVFVGEWRGAKVAIKVNNAITDIEGFLGEAKLTLGITPHPNLVQTFGVSLDGPNPCIVLEFCGGGSLDTVAFDKEKHIPNEQKRDFALKIAYGLLHLHNNNIVHRDLAARNILLTNDGQPKISDFGMSRIIQEESSQGKTKTSFGPLRWMAPESLKDKSYSTKSDVWSYGILLYELVAGDEPHVTEDQLNIAVRIRDEALTPVIPADCDPVLRQAMEICWKPNPNDRPSMEQIADFLRTH